MNSLEKKNYLLVVAMLFTTMTVTVFTACGNDDDPMRTYAGMSYYFEADETLLSLADITVEYYVDGMPVTEQITMPKWEVAARPARIPARLGYRITFSLKNNLKQTAGKYHFHIGKWIRPVIYYDQNKNEMGFNGGYSFKSESFSVEGDELENLFRNYKIEHYCNIEN